MAKSGFVPVGKVIKAHGLKGELCISSYADSPFLFHNLARVYLKFKGRYPKKHGILDLRITTKGVLLSLESISGRDKAEQWLGAEVWVRNRDVPEIEKEAMRCLELLGMAVYLKNCRYLGSIASVNNQTGQEVWTIWTPDDLEVLLPAVPEFVLEMDMGNRSVLVDPPPGLLELYHVADGR
ncbi:MAG: ribosome maturation factor RimM [Desulfovermiculus sp.]